MAPDSLPDCDMPEHGLWPAEINSAPVLRQQQPFSVTSSLVSVKSFRKVLCLSRRVHPVWCPSSHQKSISPFLHSQWQCELREALAVRHCQCHSDACSDGYSARYWALAFSSSPSSAVATDLVLCILRPFQEL